LKVPTYLDSEDVARPFVEQIGYDGTARVYTSDPSINQWPWEVRASIVPRPGFKFVFFDWSAAELAFAAYWSNCRDLIDRYEAGEDLHRFVSAEILGKKTVTDAEREVSKVVVFATIFGSEGAAVARSLKCSPEEGAQKVLKFLDRFPEIREKRDLVFAYSDKTKFTKNIFGRYRKLDLMFSQNEADIQKGHRQAFNTAIQGGIADCYKRAVIKLGKYEEKGIRYVCGVFDSILLEVPEQMAESEYRAVVDDLSFIDEIGVKFRYKIGEGKTWVEAKNQSH
jgi:DNA polymerase-1